MAVVYSAPESDRESADRRVLPQTSVDAHGLVRNAVAGGMIAAAFAGLLEAVFVLTVLGDYHEWFALPFAWFGESVFGALVGAIVGGIVLLAAKIRGRGWAARRVFGFAGGVGFAAALLVFGRMALIRNVLAGKPPSWIDEGLIAFFAVAGLVLIRYALSGIGRVKRISILIRPPVAIAGCLALGGIFLLGAAWTSDPPARKPYDFPPMARVTNQPNILIICVDTLRADYLPAYGGKAIETPALSALERESIVYEQAIAQASWTRPSIATMLTGLYPSSHGATNKQDRLRAAAPRLPQALARAGYYTAGLVNNFNIAPAIGFDKGFHVYHYMKPRSLFGASESARRLALYRLLEILWRRLFAGDEVRVEEFYYPAETVVDEAIDWIDRMGVGPWFMFLHFMDPHDPYMEHPLDQRKGFANPEWAKIKGERADELRNLYLGEIEYFDAQLDRLIAHLRTRQLFDEMVIVFVSDHGEEFFDHGGWWHGRTLYEEQIHVPLMIKLPSNDHAGERRGELARLLDLAPTVCALAGEPKPERMQGVSLIRAGAPVNPDLRHVFSEEDFETSQLKSIRGPRWKAHFANEDNQRNLPQTMLFDLHKDPGEDQDLTLGHPKRIREMGRLAREAQSEAKELGDTIAAESPEDESLDINAMDPAVVEQMKKLGYL